MLEANSSSKSFIFLDLDTDRGFLDTDESLRADRGFLDKDESLLGLGGVFLMGLLSVNTSVSVWDDDAVLPVDLRGYVHTGTRDLLLSVGLSLSDMTDMFQTIALEIRDMITLLDCKPTAFQVGSAEE